ncbi:MAG: DUF4384 domain-containing protein [Deltaproteobacteria bacterium]|nr:DUF4384 domain-containing protein [Deltaproteobacteria bacterium]
MKILRKQLLVPLVLIVLAMFPAAVVFSQANGPHQGETIKGVTAEAACAIVGMSAEQSQTLALQRARTGAIEQAAGVSVSSATLVTNAAVAVDLIKTYARGFIIREEVLWLPLGQYQKDASQPPIPEYRLKLTADVFVPRKRIPSLHLQAKLNKSVFQAGEKARITISAERPTRIALFNLMADDRVAMNFPNDHERRNVIEAGQTISLPAADSPIELEMQTLPGHERDAEAFLVVAVDQGAQPVDFLKLFPSHSPMSMPAFFQNLSTIADICEEVILPYEVNKE